MAAAWPSGLQQFLSEQNFSITIGETVLRSDMDTGAQKIRRRFTRPVNKITGSIFLDSAQYTLFYNFFNTTLAGGSLPFEFDHPITGVLTEFRFSATPRINSIGGGQFTVGFEFEELP